LNKDKAKLVAQETNKIISEGKYIAIDGNRYNITSKIQDSIALTQTTITNSFVFLEREKKSTVIEVVNCPTFEAAKGLDNVLVLNFASATNPGGGWLSGAIAQEEYLCRNSTLSACLENRLLFYKFHKEQKNPLYSSRFIYSQDVLVIRDEYDNLIKPWKCDILTAAAPYAPAIEDKESIKKVFRDRIFTVISFANYYRYDSLVLGAWGCGAFQNDIEFVAKTFHEAIKEYPYFDKIIFAILDSKEEKYIGPFKKEFVI
jgi:uncharacterized protein (TIGR02452 family)